MVKSNLLSRLLVLVCLSGAACLQVVPNGHRIASSHGVFRSQPSAMLTGRLREKTRRWRGAEEASVEAAAPAATPPVVPSPLPPRPPPPPPVAPPPVAPPPVATPPVAPLAAARSAATKVTKDSTTTPSSNIDLAIDAVSIDGSKAMLNPGEAERRMGRCESALKEQEKPWAEFKASMDTIYQEKIRPVQGAALGQGAMHSYSVRHS